MMPLLIGTNLPLHPQHAISPPHLNGHPQLPLEVQFCQHRIQQQQHWRQLFPEAVFPPHLNGHPSKLLLALIGHKAAYNLWSEISDSDIATELSKLFGLVRSGRYKYEHYRALSRLVVKRAPDIDIWNAVFELIVTVSQTTPPTSIPVSFDGTSITKSSSSFQGSEQTRRIIESAMFYEIKRCTYRVVDGFFEKYFEGRRWSRKSKAIYSAVKSNTEAGDGPIFPIRQTRMLCGTGCLVFRTNISQTHTASFTPRRAPMILPVARHSVSWMCS